MNGHFVIIGAGECGARAAETLRQEGFTGEITLVGTEALAPYERPPLSKAALTDEAMPAPRTVLAADRLEALGITFLPGTSATGLDRQGKRVSLSTGETLNYDKLLLATGASPRKLPIAGADGPRCLYLRTYKDALRLRGALSEGTRVAIIGGGFIGLEVAASARQRGAEVTVIEALPRLLARAVPEEIAGVVAALHRGRGVDIKAGAALSAIENFPGEAVVHTQGTSVMADLVVIGIGAVPEVGIAAGAGLIADNGIAVDDRLRTEDPNIFAAGDCCSFPLDIYGGRRFRLESWRNAQDQGALAARNMLGADEPHMAVPWFWSDQYEMSLQIAGLPDEGAATARRELGDGAFILFHLAHDGRLVAASGIGTGNAVARDIRLAEMLIARGARPDVADLVSADVKLKKLLAA